MQQNNELYRRIIAASLNCKMQSAKCDRLKNLFAFCIVHFAIIPYHPDVNLSASSMGRPATIIFLQALSIS